MIWVFCDLIFRHVLDISWYVLPILRSCADFIKWIKNGGIREGGYPKSPGVSRYQVIYIYMSHICHGHSQLGWWSWVLFSDSNPEPRALHWTSAGRPPADPTLTEPKGDTEEGWVLGKSWGFHGFLDLPWPSTLIFRGMGTVYFEGNLNDDQLWGSGGYHGLAMVSPFSDKLIWR